MTCTVVFQPMLPTRRKRLCNVASTTSDCATMQQMFASWRPAERALLKSNPTPEEGNPACPFLAQGVFFETLEISAPPTLFFPTC